MWISLTAWIFFTFYELIINLTLFDSVVSCQKIFFYVCILYNDSIDYLILLCNEHISLIHRDFPLMSVN